MKVFFFIGAEARVEAGAGAGEKILGAGASQKWTGSATLFLNHIYDFKYVMDKKILPVII